MKLAALALALLLPSIAVAQTPYEQAVLADQPSVYWTFTEQYPYPVLYDLVSNFPIGQAWNAHQNLNSPGGPAGGTSWHYNGPLQWGYTFAKRWQAGGFGNDEPINIQPGPMSFEVWFKSDIPSSEWTNPIISKLAAYGPAHWTSTWAGGGFSLETRYWSGGVVANICGSGVYDCVGVVGNTNFGPDEWHHIVFSFDGHSLNLYLDGQLDGYAYTDRNDLPAPTGIPLYIGDTTVPLYYCGQPGGEPYCSHGVFHGSLQHLAIYKHALSAAQVLAHFNANNDDIIELGARRSREEPAGEVSLLTVSEARTVGNLYDISGRKVKAESAGVYFQRIVAKDGTVSRRTVVVR